MPRTVPRREREWLSCTKRVSTPSALHDSSRNVSTKKPRSSPWTAGASRTRPSRRVVRRCMEGGQDRGEAASKPRRAMPKTAAMPPSHGTPPTHQTLSEYISSRFDEFSRSQKDVAQYVVDHLDE